MKAMGLKAATVCIHFPLVYQPYFDDPSGGKGTGKSAQDFSITTSRFPGWSTPGA